jgi:hypothetical protein
MSNDATHLSSRITAKVPPLLEVDRAATESQLSFSLFSGRPDSRRRKVIGTCRATSAVQLGQTIVAIKTEDFGIEVVDRQFWAKGAGNY